VTDGLSPATDGHPAACPWCGRDRIRGIVLSPDGNRWYRCAACATTFFIRLTSQARPATNNEDRRPAAPASWILSPH
jgi:transposase-like protein